MPLEVPPLFSRGYTMYTDHNFKTKKALKEAVARHRAVGVFQPGPFSGDGGLLDGVVSVEGPHYPAAHSWYARVTLHDGVIVKVA